MKAPIVITGYGIISALGRGTEVMREAFLSARSGIKPVKHLDTELRNIPVGEVDTSTDKLAAELNLSPQASRLRTVVLGTAALRDALEMADLSRNALRDVSFISGTTVGGMDNTEKFFARLAAEGGNGPDADQLAFNDCGASTRLIAEETGDFQSITTISTACSSAANAIALGAELLREGKAECVVAGGAESLSRFHLNGFNSLMILSPKFCTPFDINRDGINLGEGAAYLVMETLDHAIRRGVKPLCILSGVGNACDAYHQTATSPDAEGPTLSMLAAIADADLNPSDIDYINAHGTGTPNNDSSELTALHRVFGEKLPLYSSTKPFTGHTTSAAGAIEAVIAINAITDGIIPLNLGLTISEDRDNIPVSLTLDKQNIRHVLSNSFGFGGNDTTLIFSKLPTTSANNPLSLPPSLAKVRIASVSMISCAGVNDDVWKLIPAGELDGYRRAVEPDIKSILSPGEARRMSRILKRALATSISAIGSENHPEAIITATGLGCMENSEKFLNELHQYGEQMLKPTLFMQSTHNTIGSQIAITLNNHSYNTTYSHKEISWESALADALMQFRAGRITSALVGSHDETTPVTAGAIHSSRPAEGMISEGSVAILLKKMETDGKAQGTLSQASCLCLDDVITLYKPQISQIITLLKDFNPSALMLGITGVESNDQLYRPVIEAFQNKTVLQWKPFLGRHFSESAQAFYISCKMLSEQCIPPQFLVKDMESELESIAIINHADGIEWGITLISLAK